MQCSLSKKNLPFWSVEKKFLPIRNLPTSPSKVKHGQIVRPSKMPVEKNCITTKKGTGSTKELGASMDRAKVSITGLRELTHPCPCCSALQHARGREGYQNDTFFFHSPVRTTFLMFLRTVNASKRLFSKTTPLLLDSDMSCKLCGTKMACSISSTAFTN